MNELERIAERKRLSGLDLYRVEKLSIGERVETVKRLNAVAVYEKEFLSDIANCYRAASAGLDDERLLAEMVVALMMPSVNIFIEKELNLFGITLSEHDAKNCHERVVERLVELVYAHLKDQARIMRVMRVSDYAFALSLHLNFISFRSIDELIDIVGCDSKGIADLNGWSKLKALLADHITAVVGETYDVANRLANMKTVHYLGPMMDLMGSNVLQRLRKGVELGEVPLEKLIKLTTDLGVTLAKITGESAERVDLNIGFSAISQQLQDMKALGVVVERPERKLIE